MTSKRRARFLKAVAEAARNHRPAEPRGRPTPGNLTAEGRGKGLAAMGQAPRCRTLRSCGEQCKNPAMRGSTRCLKHGGRVEVPDHPHNIRRFLGGELGPSGNPREAWDQMSHAEQREFLAMLPAHVVKRPKLVHHAAAIWRETRRDGYRAWRRLMDDLAQPKPRFDPDDA